MPLDPRVKVRPSFNQLQLSILSRVAEHTTNFDQASSVCALLLPFLSMVGKGINDQSKTLILLIMVKYATTFAGRCFTVTFFDATDLGLERHYEMLSALFGSIFSSDARNALCQLFEGYVLVILVH